MITKYSVPLGKWHLLLGGLKLAIIALYLPVDQEFFVNPLSGKEKALSCVLGQLL